MAAPVTPVLITPANGANLGGALPPSLEWSSPDNLSGGETATLLVATDSGFSNVVYSQSGGAQSWASAGFTATPQNLNLNQTYYWGVREYSFDGTIYSPMATASFNTGIPAPYTPNLLTPANGATGVNPSGITFAWNNIGWTNYLELEIATDSGMNNVVLDYTGISANATSQTGVNLNAGTQYWWKLIATGSGGTTQSAAFTFTTQAGISTSFSETDEVDTWNNAIITPQFTSFSEQDDDDTFAFSVQDATGTNVTFTENDDPDTWQTSLGQNPGSSFVEADDQDNISFVVVSPPIVVLNPVTNLLQTSATLNGLITYTGGETTTGYGFYFGTDPNQLSKQPAASLMGGAFALNESNLSPGTTYYMQAYVTTATFNVKSVVTTFTTKSSTPGTPGTGGIALGPGINPLRVQRDWTNSFMAPTLQEPQFTRIDNIIHLNPISITNATVHYQQVLPDMVNDGDLCGIPIEFKNFVIQFAAAQVKMKLGIIQDLEAEKQKIAAAIMEQYQKYLEQQTTEPKVKSLKPRIIE